MNPPFDPGRVNGVILDMDGLLLDSERIALEIGRETALHLGAPWSREVALGMIGLNSKDGYRLLVESFGADYPVEAHQAEFGRRYEAAISAGRIPLKPGVRELFATLEARGIPMAVATSTRRSRALPKLAGVGLLERLQGVVAGDQVAQGKPAPDIYLAAARLLGTPPAACLVLEDSNTGVRGGLAAGGQVVMVPDLLPPAADVLAAGVAAVDSLLTISQLFDSA
ncbi:MAG: HAD family phosphatase [Rhodocyclaceae bacterium]|jgi:HAD superfamily hydrolase (TIGR01509 family)|nr:HAD family phosphatase [Rhodocyclaceae bacterium]